MIKQQFIGKYSKVSNTLLYSKGATKSTPMHTRFCISMTKTKRLVAVFTFFLILVFTMGIVVQADGPGALDKTFNFTGIVTTSIDGCLGEDLALQSDGKIVIVGSSYLSSSRDFALARYNNDGSLDTSFDTDGIVTTSFSNSDDLAQGVAIQSDDKIVVTGYAWNNLKLNYDFALARYNSGGNLDTDFGNTGIITTSITSGRNEGNDVAIQSDGKIVVVGYDNLYSGGNFAVARYNSNGSLDTSFDTDGKVTTDFGSNQQDTGQAVAIQPDGKVVVTGFTYDGTRTIFGLIRYNINGSLDTSFNSTGVVTTAVGTPGGSNDNGNNFGKDVAIQPDGKIVVTGLYDNGSDYDIVVIRYNSDGSLDTSFNSTGIVTTAVGNTVFSASDYGNSVAVQRDGRIVVAGTSGFDFAAIRYNTDGSLDTNFGTGGKVITSISDGVDSAQAVVIQSDGKIVAGGHINAYTGNNSLAIARYLGEVNTYLPIVFKN